MWLLFSALMTLGFIKKQMKFFFPPFVYKSKFDLCVSLDLNLYRSVRVLTLGFCACLKLHVNK